MTPRLPVRALLSVALALELAACGSGATTGAAASRAHGPGPAPEQAGTPAPGAAGASRPGGPFDLQAFENIGAPYSSLKASVVDRCGTGPSATCTLGAPDVLAGQPADVGGGDNCITTSISYDTGTKPGTGGAEFFGEGAVVTGHIDCSATGGDGGAATTTDGGPSVSGTPTESSGGSGG